VAGSEHEDRARFEELVGDALDGLPEWVREKLENISVAVEDDPPDGNPTLLGLYEGIPLTNRGVQYTWAMPDRITLFRHNIERASRHRPDVVRRVVAHTVIHEIAHFFGISDDRLRELGAY
jgi:predicted Zn-dependent protease with MMP-like domain